MTFRIPGIFTMTSLCFYSLLKCQSTWSASPKSSSQQRGTTEPPPTAPHTARFGLNRSRWTFLGREKNRILLGALARQRVAGKHFVLPSPLYLNWTWCHQASSFVRGWLNREKYLGIQPASDPSRKTIGAPTLSLTSAADEKLETFFKEKRNWFCTVNFLSSKVKQNIWQRLQIMLRPASSAT